jgi:hypothetical protein
LRLLGSFGIFSHVIPTGTARRSGDPIPTEPSVAPSKGGTRRHGAVRWVRLLQHIGGFSRIPAALGFDRFFDFVRCTRAATIHVTLLGLRADLRGNVALTIGL